MSKEHILHIVASKPKSYHRIIANTPELLEWVKTNTLVQSTRLVEEIYSAVHQVSNICPNGNTKSLDRWSTGFKFCGPASACNCAKEAIASNVSATRRSATTAQKEATNIKRKATMLQRYGTEYNSQRADIKHVLQSPKISESAYSKLTDYRWLYCEYVEKKRSLVDIAAELDVYYGTVTEYCRKFNFEIRQTSKYSLVEREVSEWIESFGVECVSNDRSTLKTHELDIFIPSHKLAIEVNGLYWHSHDPLSGEVENKNRHLNKLNLATAAGIRLIQITDYEWKHKQRVVKSMIKHALGLSNRLAARHCTVGTVDQQTASDFIFDNMLNTDLKFTGAVGLFRNSDLVMLALTCCESNEVTVSFCTVLGRALVGGISKIISYLKRHLQARTFVVQCTLLTHTGTALEKLKFISVSQTAPTCAYTDGNAISQHTETASLRRRYWNCGFKIFKLKVIP